MATQAFHRTVLQAARSSPHSLPRFNCRRIPVVASDLYRQPPRQFHATPRQRQEEDSRQQDTSPDIEPYTPPPPKTYISYPVAALIAATSAGFLIYRLFIYSPTSDNNPLDPSSFVARHLSLKQAISPTLSLFNLNAGTNDADDRLWTQGVWSVEFKQPELQIARAYTPLPPVKLKEESEGAWSARTKGLRFIIRREANGEVSPYVHGLSQGSKLELRGPTPELILPPDVSEVVFLAGGTGIAPAMQVAYALSRRAARGETRTPDGAPVRMSILWASRSRDDTGANYGAANGTFVDRYASIPGQLDAIADDSRAAERFNLSTRYFIDEEGAAVTDAALRDAIKQPSLLSRPSPATEGRKIVLVSGPDGFVAHVAGPKAQRNGLEEQGAVAGLLGKLDLSGWMVWKL